MGEGAALRGGDGTLIGDAAPPSEEGVIKPLGGGGSGRDEGIGGGEAKFSGTLGRG